MVTNGTTLTNDQVKKILIQPLEKKSVFLAAVPKSNVFNSNGSPVRVPKLPDPTNPDWVGENELITEKDATFNEITLLPSNMKSVKVITRFSNELARQAVVDISESLKLRLVRDVAYKMDDALLNSTGANNTPVGIRKYPGIQSMAAVGKPTLDHLHDAVGLALGADVDPEGGLRWMMNSRDFVGLRKLKDSQNRYQLQPDPTEPGKYLLLGYPVTVTNRIPKNGGTGTNESEVVLADFSQIAVARDLAPSVTLLTERFAEYDQQALRVITRYDAAPMNPAAVVVLKAVTA
ncbi:phage major capsid protein [uncultured Nocardioides sp.]|uniref:phage major capsid protein n=1 Tax=uncultured Nocardioides sp. TaxID=198441 RepID=UPI0026197AFA|nr:phage major capsid protein [uncultured Nocardioides sp.]